MLPLYSALHFCSLLATCENLQGLSQMPYRKVRRKSCAWQSVRRLVLSSQRATGTLSHEHWISHCVSLSPLKKKIKINVVVCLLFITPCPFLFMYLFLCFFLLHTPLLCPCTFLLRWREETFQRGTFTSTRAVANA